MLIVACMFTLVGAILLSIAINDLNGEINIIGKAGFALLGLVCLTSAIALFLMIK